MADTHEKAKPAGVAGRGCLTLFFSLFLAAGLTVLSVLVPATLRHAATYVWTRVPCTMVESRIVPRDTVEGGAAGWYVRFAYTVDGIDYIGTRLNVNNTTGDAREDLRRSQQLAPGTPTSCLVNPRDPSEAVLERQSVGLLFVPLFPLIFVAVGVGGIVFAWRRDRAVTSQALTARVDRRGAEHRRGLAITAAFGGVFFAVGIGLTWGLFVRPVLGVLAARSWPDVPCEIVSSEVVSHDSDDGTTYSVEITYRYSVDGRAYLSNRYGFMGFSSSGYAGKAAVVARHPPGSEARCFVNPADPTDAVLHRGWSGTLWFGLIPVLFTLVGGGLMVGVFRAWRSPSTADGIRDGAWAPPVRGPASFRTGVPERAAAVAGDSPVELKPAATRKVKVIGAVIVALFWNGIVSVFLVQLVGDGWSGFSWFLALFLTPFVAVGVFLLGVAGRQILSLSNPVPRLTLGRGALRPGGRLEVTWQLSGRVAAVRRLRLTLEGREEATYRRGTDTRTDREVFATLVLADVTDGASLASGRAVLELPGRMMHSFTARNNKVVWLLRVKGDVPRWPDIDDEYPVHIAPDEGNHHG